MCTSAACAVVLLTHLVAAASVDVDPSAMVVAVVSAATTAKHGAKCLDGSPPAYKMRIGTGANATKFILFLEGGGWCFGVADCAKRRGGGLGSSSSYRPGTSKGDLGGVMAFSATTNPDFHTWTMVFAHYCDGSSFSSFRPDPISTAAGPMWFRGKANLDAILDELSSAHGMNAATELILSGGSAGGLAVYYHLDYVADFMRNQAPACRVTGFPDAGYFADLQAMGGGGYLYRGFFQTADSTAWNTTVSGGSNAACLAAETAAAPWKCLMAEYLTDHIVTPMFVMNAAFDVYQVQNILDVGCVPNNCSTAQISAIEGYRRDFLNSSIAHLVTRAQAGFGHGAWIDSCLVHEQNLDYCSGGNPHAYNCAGWLTTKIAGVTPQQAYSAWYRGDPGTKNVTIDAGATVENPTCPWSFTHARATHVDPAVSATAAAPPSPPPQPPPHLRFMSMYGLDPDAQHTFVNMNLEGSEQVKLDAWTKYNMTSFYGGLEGVFVRGVGLVSNWTAVLDGIINTSIAPNFGPGKAWRGVFLGDEICCRNVGCWANALQPVAARLHAALGPEAIIYTNECRTHLSKLKEVPKDIDLISVDVYNGYLPGENGTSEVASAKAVYEGRLFPKLQPHQRAMVVPGVMACSNLSFYPLAMQSTQIVAKLDGYLEWAKAEPRIAGFSPWHFLNRTGPQSGGACDMALGAVAMPGVVAKLKEIGQFIIAGQQ